MILKGIKGASILGRSMARSIKAVLGFKDTGKLGDFIYYGHTLDKSLHFAFVESTESFKQTIVHFLIKLYRNIILLIKTLYSINFRMGCVLVCCWHHRMYFKNDSSSNHQIECV